MVALMAAPLVVHWVVALVPQLAVGLVVQLAAESVAQLDQSLEHQYHDIRKIRELFHSGWWCCSVVAR